MVTELRVRNQAQQLYVRALSSAYRNGVQVFEPSLWLQRDPEAEEKMLRDPDIAHAVGYRRHMIAGRQWSVVPKRETPRSPLAVMVATDLLENIQNFTAARFCLARAFFSGARFAKIHGRTQTLTIGDGKPRTWWVPVRIEDFDKRWFRQVTRFEGEEISAHWEHWNLGMMRWDPHTVDQALTTIKHVYNDDQSSLGYGSALREALGWAWYAKTNIGQETLTAIERYAGGMLVAKVDGARDAATGLPNTELITQMLNTLADMRARHTVVIDSSDEIEVIPAPTGGHEVMDNMRAELRSSIFTLVLGANLTTSADKGGSFALADVQENSTEALIQYDREILEETLTDDLIGCVWRKNWANIVEMEIAEEKPRFSITQEKREDPEKSANVARTLHDMGVALPLVDVLEKAGYRKPDDGEETIKGAEPAPALAGFGPDMGGGEQGLFPFAKRGAR